MEQAQPSTRQSIEKLLKAPHGDCFGIVGKPEAGWLMISRLKLGDEFNKSVCPIIIQFPDDGNDPVILVPEGLEIRPDDKVCPHFIGHDEPAEGWKPLCPHMFQDVGDEMLEFIASLAGLMANPSICGLMGCEGRDTTQQNR